MPRGKRKAEAPAKNSAVKTKAKSSAPSSNGLAQVMKATADKAKAMKIDVLTPTDFDELMGVKFYISTGLPSLDINLIQDKENVEDGVSPYGWPTGRIVEISGKENSYKSWLLHSACAQVRKMGGLVFQVYTEADFDIQFFRYFYDKKGLDFEKDVIPYVMQAPATTVDDVKHSVSTFIKSLKEYYDGGGQPIPAIISIDSLGALLSDTNLSKMDKDEEDQVGAHAKDLHKFFKRVKNDCARYNILLMFTNHTRVKLGGSYGGEDSAHESAVKYYASLRVNLAADKGGDKTTSFGVEYLKNRKVRVTIKKIKGTLVGNGKFELLAQPNIGFDYLGSLIEGCRLTRLLIKKGNGQFEFRGDPDANKYVAEIVKTLNGTTTWGGEVALRKFLKEDHRLIVLLEKACYSIGPHTLEDEDDLTSGASEHLEEGLSIDIFEDEEE